MKWIRRSKHVIMPCLLSLWLYGCNSAKNNSNKENVEEREYQEKRKMSEDIASYVLVNARAQYDGDIIVEIINKTPYTLQRVDYYVKWKTNEGSHEERYTEYAMQSHGLEYKSIKAGALEAEGGLVKVVCPLLNLDN